MDAGLLPVKCFDQAKGRLGPEFGSDERALVARALWADAKELCLGAGFLEWWVVSDDAEVLADAGAAGLGTVTDSGRGLNPALRDGIEVLITSGADSVTIVPCDIPLAFSGDLEDLLDTGATSDVVVVPSGDDGGTNGLYLSPPALIEPSFGPGSMQSHVRAAERLKLRCTILDLPRMALDLDTIEDVDAYLARPKFAPSRAAEVLTALRPALDSAG